MDYILILLNTCICLCINSKTTHCYTFDWYYLCGECYGLSRENATYATALSACQQEQGDLANVLTLTEYALLNSTMDGVNEYWVGLTYNGTGHYWSNGEIPLASLWYPTEPNNNDSCVRLTKTNGLTTEPHYLLADRNCSYIFKFICQKKRVFGTLEVGWGRQMVKEDLYDYEKLSSFISRSRLVCGIRCSENVKCMAFGYNLVNKECELYKLAETAFSRTVDGNFSYYLFTRPCS